MKTNTLLAVSFFLIAGALTVSAQQRIITITQTTDNQTNTVNVADFEYVKVLSGRDLAGSYPSSLAVSKAGANMQWAIGKGVISASGNIGVDGLVFAGPAQVTINSGTTAFGGSRTSPLFVTLEIGPIAYPVTNSITIGPGQSAEVNLENSTNLVQPRIRS
jgi:hypothetical protein